MISVILYGRNDAHGYNLHRRAALSLNCLAEVLSDPDDEIVFVDYNTPDELPTFVETISDTLTDRCLGLLRVLRVPAAIHLERFESKTHLPALEPVSRNAAVRRANPSNRWLLSTNTDMVILSLVGTSLSEVCADLPDGFYGLPRFELPEWLWERLPRSDPRSALAAIERLGPSLRLDTPTAAHEWIRFDAPGDFQLILRDDFTAIDGFNEEMLLGYHVDANLSRRMFLRRGSIETLGGRLAGYHCNHNRVPTVYHGDQRVENDLTRFWSWVNRAELPEQRVSWGLADVTLEDVPVRSRVGLTVGDRVASVLADEMPAPASADAQAAHVELTYDSAHVLPFVADSLVVSPSSITVGYIGANPVLRGLLAALITELDFDQPLEAVDLKDLGSVDRLDLIAGVVVVDLGVDAAFVDASPVDYLSVELPHGIERVLLALERLIGLERARIGRGEHPRRIVLVNSATVYWDAYILAHLDCSYTTFYSRVRRATVKPISDESFGTGAAREFARRLIGWSARSNSGHGRLQLRDGARVKVADLEDFAGFGSGWAFPDGLGVWTQGRRSDLALTLDGREGRTVLALGVGGLCVTPDDGLKVELFMDGERIATRDFRSDEGQALVPVRRPLPDRVVDRLKRIVPYALVERLGPLYERLTANPAAEGAPRFAEVVWNVELPVVAISRRDAQLTFVIDDPHSPLEVGWSRDERPLGIHLRWLKLERGTDISRMSSRSAHEPA